MPGTPAILGWGSLLWDHDKEFDKIHDDWQYDGPTLELEFSRKSRKRDGGLTLVIDPKHGRECQVAYAMSKVGSEIAIPALIKREGTVIDNIGRYSASGSFREQARDAASLNAIKTWAAKKGIDMVIWTDLGGHFDAVDKSAFVTEAIEYVRTLPQTHPRGLDETRKYVWSAPDFIKTPLRDALQSRPWFPRP